MQTDWPNGTLIFHKSWNRVRLSDADFGNIDYINMDDAANASVVNRQETRLQQAVSSYQNAERTIKRNASISSDLSVL